MLGTIGLKEFRIDCIIGTEPHERNNLQELLIDLKVETDFSKVCASEQLSDTINYVSLADICRQLAVDGKYRLIEKYAYDVLQLILKKHSVRSAWICVKKQKAIPGAECALVELKCENQQ